MRKNMEHETLKTEGPANSDLGAVMRSCSNCKFFKSFWDAYYDDMEPDDEGFCRNGDSPRYGNEGANNGYVCDFHNYA